MNEPKLEAIDLRRFLTALNRRVDSDEEIELGGFVDKEPRKNPFHPLLDRLRDRDMIARGKYLLTRTSREGFLGVFGSDTDVRIGYVFVETGFWHVKSSETEKYEVLKLRIKKPVELRSGLVVPNCSVKLFVTTDEYAAPLIERRDHVRAYGVNRRGDLSRVLPTEWFLRKGVEVS